MTNQTIENQSIPFSKLIPDFKYFVSKSNTRPALQNIYNNGQYTVATDTHVAIKIDNEIISNNINPDHAYDPKKEFHSSEVHYPDVTRIFPYESETKTRLYKKDITTIVASLKEAKKIVKALPNKDIKIELSNNKLNIIGLVRYMKDDEISKEEHFEQSFDIDWGHEDLTICVNSVLLINALSAMKKYLSNFDKDGYILAEFYGQVRPMLFTSKDEKFQTLVMPMRKIK